MGDSEFFVSANFAVAAPAAAAVLAAMPTGVTTAVGCPPPCGGDGGGEGGEYGCYGGGNCGVMFGPCDSHPHVPQGGK